MLVEGWFGVPLEDKPPDQQRRHQPLTPEPTGVSRSVIQSFGLQYPEYRKEHPWLPLISRAFQGHPHFDGRHDPAHGKADSAGETKQSALCSVVASGRTRSKYGAA